MSESSFDTHTRRAARNFAKEAIKNALKAGVSAGSLKDLVMEESFILDRTCPKCGFVSPTFAAECYQKHQHGNDRNGCE